MHYCSLDHNIWSQWDGEYRQMVPIIRYKITGTGVTRALQKATDEQKDLVIVHDKDRLGRPVNVGYYLVPRGAAAPTNPNIVRFDLKEIDISVDNTNSDFAKPVLGAEFHHPRKDERHFLLNLPIGEDSQFVLRNLFRLTNGVTSRFVI